MTSKTSFHFLLITLLFCNALNTFAQLQVGAYYFDGWAGHPKQMSTWAIKENAPIHLTDKLCYKYSERKPVWGWRDDDISIMERQIDLAADNGIDFFMFCWYYCDNKGRLNAKNIESHPLNTSIQLFMKAKNKHKMKFAVMLANHPGYEIYGKENWDTAMQYIIDHYINDPQYLKIEGCPVVEFFNSEPAHYHINNLKSLVKKNGYKDLCFFSCGKFFSDADINGWYNIREKSTGFSEERSYETLTKYVEKCWYWKNNSNNVVPIVMAGWDKRPWEAKEQSLYYTKRHYKLFFSHFEQAIKCIESSKPKIPMIMVYAWNEMGEGGYLVPTIGDPNAMYLKQIKKARRKHNL